MTLKLNQIMKLFGILLILLASANYNAQSIKRSVIGSQGTSAGVNGMKIQSTVGQPSLVSNHKNSETGIRQGFNQPVTTVVETDVLELSVYPNPSNGDFEFLVGYLNGSKLNDASYNITNVQGAIIEVGTVISEQKNQITLGDIAPGTYFLQVTTEAKAITTKLVIL